MARVPRDDFPGAWHHVMHRASNRKAIFRSDTDYLLFLDVLTDTVAAYQLEVHAYALMPNHYHLLVRSVHGTLSRGMRHLNGVFTQRLNARHGWDGAVFRGRFASRLITDERHLLYVLAYIHLNPLKANLVTRVDHDDAWTSHCAYLDKVPQPEWLSCDHLRDALGGARALHETVLGLHRGKLDWPLDFALEKGFPTFGVSTRAERTKKPPSKTVPGRGTLNAHLSKIREITATTRKELCRGVRGPKGNPARRFAVWALAKDTLLTHADIGKLLGMTGASVAKDLARPRKHIEPFSDWAEAWLLYMSIGLD